MPEAPTSEHKIIRQPEKIVLPDTLRTNADLLSLAYRTGGRVRVQCYRPSIDYPHLGANAGFIVGPANAYLDYDNSPPAQTTTIATIVISEGNPNSATFVGIERERIGGPLVRLTETTITRGSDEVAFFVTELNDPEAISPLHKRILGEIAAQRAREKQELED